MAPFSAAVDAVSVDVPLPFCLDEDAFRLLYLRTAGPLRAYLRRLLNDTARADDALQESYLRLLQAKLPSGMSDEHLKNYLFRIATNVSRTELVRRRPAPLTDRASPDENAELRADMDRLLNRMNPRQRELLWLAYVERFSHEEIGRVVGAKTASIRPMLARARERFSEILKEAGLRPPAKSGEER